ncbi:hypothetical protein DL765_010832 [Monosporascus sp. GIB2]|nr:hypothetical protein DL765_010832 [Monosporascus sp. GIB2]
MFSLKIGRLLADVGLPWHNNQINMPNEIDTSWPFHFKSFEMGILCAKGAASVTLMRRATNGSREQKERLVRLGGSLTGKGEVVLTVQPQTKLEHLESVISIMSPTTQHYSAMNLEQGLTCCPFPESIVNELRATVQSWKMATRSAAGYPFHMGSLSTLGPVIGRFLDLIIPDDWVRARSGEILTARMETFGLHTAQDRLKFQGAFTNGSTMGNRVGIHVALRHFPDAFMYFSESHYSVIKTMRDCDVLTNRWVDRGPHYSQIPSDASGSILVEALVKQALADKMQCLRRGEDYRMILFANIGTTFVGARDDLARIRTSLNAAGIEVSYIHVDGALDFGFDNCGIALGPPGSTGPDHLLRVQGITLSHHKAMGSMVSGEVLCYSPGGELASLVSPIDPRVVFETWLYSQIYTLPTLVRRSNTAVPTPRASYVKPLLSSDFMRSVKLRRVQCESPLGEKLAKLAQSLQPLNSAYDTCPDATVDACIRGAVSVAVIDEEEQLQAVFLAESLRDMSIRVGPILMASTYRDYPQAMLDIGAQLIGFMARHMQAKLRTDGANYRDVDERARQVAYMRLVYQHAGRVVVYLGPGDAGRKRAFARARELCNFRAMLLESFPESARQATLPSQTSTRIDEMMPEALNADSQPKADLTDLFKSTYFERVWCIQEVAASKECIAKSGDAEINFYDLLSVASLIELLEIESGQIKPKGLKLWITIHR